MSGIEKVIKELKIELEKLYEDRLEEIILYGSYARGEETPDSDIDIAVILSDEVKKGEEIDRMIDIITDLNLKYDVLISIYPVSKDDYEHLGSPIIKNMRREGAVA
ncbi:MAG: nucleotidyltransferase domain-containing protein [Thermoplasmatota archaeon]